ITGTPIENSLIDLWSQLSFANPGLLGDLKYFREHFYQPIEKSGSKSSEKRFREIINPFILRRTKNEVAHDLPDLTEKVQYCPMSGEQAILYEKRKSEIRNYILDNRKLPKEKKYMMVLSGLMRLRLIANHPIMGNPEYPGQSGKFEVITDYIGKTVANEHKLLIFSQFVKHLNIYASWLESSNIPYLTLTGKTPAAHRERIINMFQNDKNHPVFLISLKAGGVGLNLTHADSVFLLEPWWNPAVEKQAINRTHRIGQVKNVFSYKFITENSIEEKILQLQQKNRTCSIILLIINLLRRLVTKILKCCWSN
ncbi:MAG: DEAD/DEAH box helicase, partial [bacterium]